MLEFLSVHGDTLVAISIGLLALGGLLQRDRNKEIRIAKLEVHSEDCITLDTCQQRQDGCQRFYEAEFAHGKDEFTEMKSTFARMKECNEAQHKDIMARNDRQHKDIMDHLLNNKTKG